MRRITQCSLNGGHEVPISKIVLRYYEFLLNIALVDRIYVYDNSVENQMPQLLFRTVDGVLFKQYRENILEWGQLLLR
jgi:predicted ABC-type ATPase